MYTNLVGELAKKRIEICTLAETLHLHRNSIYNKLYGKSDFTVTEAFTIHDVYFPDIDMRFLFERNAM